MPHRGLGLGNLDPLRENFSGSSLDVMLHLRPKLEGSGAGEHPKKNWDPLLISATVEASNFKFGMQLGFGTSLAKKSTFRTKIGGGLGQGSIRKNFWTPYLFLQPTEKLVHNRFTLPNTSFRTKLGRV